MTDSIIMMMMMMMMMDGGGDDDIIMIMPYPGHYGFTEATGDDLRENDRR